MAVRFEKEERNQYIGGKRSGMEQREGRTKSAEKRIGLNPFVYIYDPTNADNFFLDKMMFKMQLR